MLLFLFLFFQGWALHCEQMAYKVSCFSLCSFYVFVFIVLSWRFMIFTVWYLVTVNLFILLEVFLSLLDFRCYLKITIKKIYYYPKTLFNYINTIVYFYYNNSFGIWVLGTWIYSEMVVSNQYHDHTLLVIHFGS